MAVPNCLRLLVQLAKLACFFALANAGKSIPARIAIIAMTTSSSISVNAQTDFFRKRFFKFIISADFILFYTKGEAEKLCVCRHTRRAGKAPAEFFRSENNLITANVKC